MASILKITPREARRLAIVHQGLHTKKPFGPGKKGLMQMLDQIGYVQIDTISVVERAHHHVIWSRVPGYRKSHLLDLQVKDRKVLEYWSHAAAFVPMADYRYTLPVQETFKKGKDPWPQVEAGLMQSVLDRVKSEGPLMSKDFDRAKNPKGDGWWEWKPAKLALQRLFFEGQLVVSHRKGFQRVYDVPENVLPIDTEVAMPTQIEYVDYLINRYLKAHGFGTAKMISYLRRGMNSLVQKRLRERWGNGELVKLEVGRNDIGEIYALKDVMEQLSTKISKRVHILSPFDNAVIQRQRLSFLFNFDYLIECYVPKPKRVFGYFVLPILSGDQFVGRMDAKADRKTGILHIHSLHLQDNITTDQFVEKFAPAALEFMKWNNCESIHPGSEMSSELIAALREIR